MMPTALHVSAGTPKAVLGVVVSITVARVARMPAGVCHSFRWAMKSILSLRQCRALSSVTSIKSLLMLVYKSCTNFLLVRSLGTIRASSCSFPAFGSPCSLSVGLSDILLRLLRQEAQGTHCVLCDES